MNEFMQSALSLLPAGHIDAHTHLERFGAIVCIDPVSVIAAHLLGRKLLRPSLKYSVGIHPYNFSLATGQALRLLSSLALSPEVVAIGECGLDASSGPFNSLPHISRQEILTAQTELLKIHIELSETLCKPLLLHIVKAFPEIIQLKKSLRPSQPWIIHGFRGKPELAAELLSHGFYLSFGSRYNPLSLAATPASKRLYESDLMTDPLCPSSSGTASGTASCGNRQNSRDIRYGGRHVAEATRGGDAGRLNLLPVGV